MSDVIENNEPVDICTFILEGSPLMYYGELYYDAEDTEKNKLVFRRTLVKVENLEDKTAKWIRVPTAGRDSLVQIDTRVMRGVLVKNIDQKEAAAYKEASLKLYSGLHLAGN
jgi:hypothetical protein